MNHMKLISVSMRKSRPDYSNIYSRKYKNGLFSEWKKARSKGILETIEKK